MTISARLRERIEDVAGELRRELYGEQGYPEWGTKFAAMETEACAIGDALTCELLNQALQSQAEEQSSAQACPCGVCGEPTRPHPDGPAPQVLTSRRGEVTWNAAHFLCDRCRQAFFPSAPNAGAAT
jgi:hypothetical protein